MNNIVETQKRLVGLLPIPTDYQELIKRYIDTAYQTGLTDGKLEALTKSIETINKII